MWFEDGCITRVTVSRLVDWMKAESLRETIGAMRTLGRQLPLRFDIIGVGTSRGVANAELGGQAIVLTGALIIRGRPMRLRT
jgi:hypothetical protein